MESALVKEDQKSAEHSECPRCGSTHTKFCYYNNYNKSQPRYFCKGCRRHWTKGGILRNVPLGNIRKKKRQRKPPISALVTNTSIISSQDEQEGAAEDQSRVVSDALVDNILGSRDDQNGVFSCETALKSADQSTEFCYSDIGALDIKKSAILEPNDPCSDAYGYILSQPFQNPTTTTGAMDMSNISWDWNEINSLISADLDIPLDEAEISF